MIANHKVVQIVNINTKLDYSTWDPNDDDDVLAAAISDDDGDDHGGNSLMTLMTTILRWWLWNTNITYAMAANHTILGIPSVNN